MAQPPASAPRDETVPLTSDLRRLHVTVSKRFLDKLEAARSALSHSIPAGTTEQILEAALDLVLAKDARKKGLVAKPRPAPTEPAEPGVRYVPAAVRRTVWKRDGGRCQWPDGSVQAAKTQEDGLIGAGAGSASFTETLPSRAA